MFPLALASGSSRAQYVRTAYLAIHYLVQILNITDIMESLVLYLFPSVDIEITISRRYSKA